MQIDCSMPAALFSSERSKEKNPSAVTQTKVHIQTPVSDTVFHIFLISVMVLIKSNQIWLLHQIVHQHTRGVSAVFKYH